MTGLSELLLPFSIEDFLSAEDVDKVVQSIDAYKSAIGGQRQQGPARVSIHSSRDHNLTELIDIITPRGRLDINVQEIPRAVIQIMEAAFYSRIEDIRRAYPGAYAPYGFTYVEYTVGQYFTPHIDGASAQQVAGFGVTLSDDFHGGEFFVETCGSNRLWMTTKSGTSVAPGPNANSDWYRVLPKTRWVTRPRRGGAIFYGSSLTHGCNPVTAGVLRKVLAFVRR